MVSESKNILITGPDIAKKAMEVLSDCGFKVISMPPYTVGKELSSYIEKFDPIAIISRMGKIERHHIYEAKSLRIIAKHGVGVDNIDIQAANEKGIPVAIAYGANSISVAEHTIALMLAIVKRLPSLNSRVKDGYWDKPDFQGVELFGKTMALIGFGSIAQHTANFAKSLGLKVQAFDPGVEESVFNSYGVLKVDSFETCINDADIISLHCPLNASTSHIINKNTLRLMKQGAYIVNTARGGLIHEDDLLDAINSGRVAAVGMDTFELEPTNKDNPLWGLPNVLATPHIGGVTKEGSSRVSLSTAHNIVLVLENKVIPQKHIFNFSNLTRKHHECRTINTPN